MNFLALRTTRNLNISCYLFFCKTIYALKNSINYLMVMVLRLIPTNVYRITVGIRLERRVYKLIETNQRLTNVVLKPNYIYLTLAKKSQMHHVK